MKFMLQNRYKETALDLVYRLDPFRRFEHDVEPKKLYNLLEVQSCGL